MANNFYRMIKRREKERNHFEWKDQSLRDHSLSSYSYFWMPHIYVARRIAQMLLEGMWGFECEEKWKEKHCGIEWRRQHFVLYSTYSCWCYRSELILLEIMLTFWKILWIFRLEWLLWNVWLLEGKQNLIPFLLKLVFMNIHGSLVSRTV